MSSPCCSLPHLLSSSPPKHEAPPGQHDLLQDDTVHGAPLPEPTESTSSANEPLSHVNHESGGIPRKASPQRNRWVHSCDTRPKEKADTISVILTGLNVYLQRKQ